MTDAAYPVLSRSKSQTSIPTRKLQLRCRSRRFVVPADEVVLQFVEMNLPQIVDDAVEGNHRRSAAPVPQRVRLHPPAEVLCLADIEQLFRLRVEYAIQRRVCIAGFAFTRTVPTRSSAASLSCISRIEACIVHNQPPKGRRVLIRDRSSCSTI